MKKAFALLRDLKSVVFSTVDDGMPRSRVVDIMYYDEQGLYFVTLKVKPFYRQLIAGGKVAVTGITTDHTQIRIVGNVRELNRDRLNEIYVENPSLKELFPDPDNTNTFSVFQIYSGKGEIFDLSGKETKLHRIRFAFGGEVVRDAGCKITDRCIGCGQCKKSCPFGAIEEGTPYKIDSRYCDECGICYSICPVNAIDLPTGM